VSLRERLARGVAWNGLGILCTQGSTLLVNLIVANILGREIFGKYAVIQNALATLGTIAQLAVGFTATKFVAELRVKDPARAGRIVGLSSILAALSGVVAGMALALGARLVAERGYHAPDLAPLLLLASAAVVFSVVNGFHLGALAGLEAYSAIGRTGMMNGALNVALCVSGAGFGGLRGLVAALGVSGLVQCVSLRWTLLRECDRAGITVTLKDAHREAGIISRFTVPAALGGLSNMTATWLATVMLVREPSGITEMALFTAANSFRIALLFLPNVVSNVGLSLFNQQRGVGNHAGSRRVFQTTLWMNIAVTCAGALPLALAGPLILRVFGRGFPEGAGTLAILILATPLESAWYSVAHLISSHDRVWPMFVFGVVPRDVVTVLMARTLVPEFGSRGLAAALGCGWLAGLVLLCALKGRRAVTTPTESAVPT
jgi:O-antigen/teichoic acid export membrane protein